MLRELCEWLLTRETGPARGLHLDREAVAIAARYRRRHEAWAPHLAATRRLILDAAAACPQRGTALVLGSGHCLDVPLPELAAAFARVVLVDAHHPRAARHLAGNWSNVRLVTADLTGLAGWARQAARGKAGLPRPLPVPDLACGERPDFTASVNLASQLPQPFGKLLGRRLSEEALADLGRELVEAHFAALAGLPGRVCLVCDLAWERLAEGRVTAASDALAGAARPAPDREWLWDIAPRPEESFSHDRRNRVGGWLDFKAALAGCPGPGAEPAG